ncbi:MAG: PKD domain-containing protein, partial [Bacteroidota bacterium]
YDVTLSVVDVNGCDSSITKPNFVNIRELMASFWADTTFAACPPLTVNFFANDSFPHSGVQWFWDFGNGATSTQVQPTHVFTQPGTYTVTLVLTSPTGCTDTMRITDMITIEGPTADFTYSPDEGCPGTEVFFEALSADSVEFEWIFGDGNTGQGQVSSHIYTEAGLFQPILVIEDTLGCRVFNQAPESVEIFPAPTAMFTANIAELCDSGTVTFIDQSTSDSPIMSWYWEFGDGQTDTVQYPQHTYTQVGNYTVSLTVLTADSCTETISLTDFIRVHPSPELVLTADPSRGCMPLDVQLTGAAPGHPHQIDSWHWDVGFNGETTSTQTMSFDYLEAGTYYPTLSATDEKGCSRTVSDTIVVYPLPFVNFAASDSFGCAPAEISFQDLVTTPLAAWQWDFGDGNASLDSTPVHRYLQDGTYGVSLTVWDTLGCMQTLTKPAYIHLDHPVAAFSVEDQQLCPDVPALFTDQSHSDTTLHNWFWTFGDGGVSSQPDPVYPYDSTGVYDVSLWVEDIFGCRDSISSEAYIEVLRDEVPDVLAMERVSVMDDQSVEVFYEAYENVHGDFGHYRILRADGLGKFQIVGEVNELSQTRFVDTEADPRTKIECYKVQVVNHCGTSYDPELAATHCTIQLENETVPGVEAVRLNWNSYQGWPFVETYRLYRVTNYHARGELIATLDGSDSTYLDEDMYCYDQYSYRLEALGSTRMQSWSDTTFATPDHLLPVDSGHIVRATVEDNRFVLVEWKAAWPEHAESVVIEKNGGTGFKEVYRAQIDNPETKYQDEVTQVDERSYAYRVFTVDSCGDYTPQGRIGKTIHLETVRTHGTVNLQWTPYEGWENGVDVYQIERYSEQDNRFVEIDLIPGSETNYIDETAETGQPINCYRITAFEMGGTATFSSSNEGCVALPPQMFSANAFTPNGDGSNDVFEVKGTFLDGFELEIFNRWGRKVFSTRTPGQGWNGLNQDGQPAQEGVYVFIARGVGYEGERIQRVGSITLVR